MFKLNEFDSSASLANEMAQEISQLLTDGINSKGSASLAVSGGKTPIEFFTALSKQNIEWEKVFITLVDDRWVDADDDASNEKLVNTYLLQNNAKTAQFVGLKNEAKSPYDGESKTEECLNAVPMPFDAIVLGMGEDGHTASLFPEAENLRKGLDLSSGKKVIAMTPVHAPLDRMTLTLPAILSSKHLFLHLVGESKMNVLKKALQCNDELAMPICSILNQTKVDLSVFWCE